MIYLNFDTSWICDTFKLNMLQLKHMKYPSNNISLYSRVAPESENTCAWAASAHETQENCLSTHSDQMSRHSVLFWFEHASCASDQNVQIFMCEKHTHMSSLSDALEERQKRPIWESTFQPLAHQAPTPFHTMCTTAHCLLPLARHAEHFLAPVPLVQRKIPLTSTKTAFSSPRLPC